MKLEDIGFYTLSDERACTATSQTSLSRCELLLTARCNFRCPYCRSVGGQDLPFAQAERTIRLWANEGLKNIRFSGGEPTLYSRLLELVGTAKQVGVQRIAISTNGSADSDLYWALWQAGVNDFSVSLDACCAEDGDRLAGGVKGAWGKVCTNIQRLTGFAYVTVGIVLTEQNLGTVNDIIRLAHNLGVADIRVIPAAQNGAVLQNVRVDDDLLRAHPILRYRIENMQSGRSVRGLQETDSHRCGLVLDDMAVMGSQHYPCIIYMRENGMPIGEVSAKMRKEREEWYQSFDPHTDPICQKNCLDVCVDYNNRHAGPDK
jgi:molybdenum cofactor biosynthesis enzyme MoaA